MRERVFKTTFKVMPLQTYNINLICMCSLLSSFHSASALRYRSYFASLDWISTSMQTFIDDVMERLKMPTLQF